MSKNRFTFLVVLLIALPSVLHAFGMVGLVDEISLQTKAVGKVVFSHNGHGKMYGCDACHPKLYQKKSSGSQVSMKAMEKGKSCGACHNGQKAFNVTGDCASCHAGDIQYKEKDAGDVIFSHAAHTGMFGCDACHPDLFRTKRGANKATMEEMEQGRSCGACHDGSAAFGVAEDCQSCHNM